MSDDARQVEEPSFDADSVLDMVEDYYHVPTLALVFGFMLWVRLQAYGNFVRDGQVYFSGNDPWYHFREVEYAVTHWPAVMPFDPWTGFPEGTSVGQFGTLYDQLIATAALVVGLGDPSSATVARVLLVTPAVFGALIAVPTYLIGKRLGGRFAGVMSAIVLALFPGLFLQRSLVGAADHNIAEPFFQGFAVLAMMVAVAVAERERPIYEQVAGREFESLRRPLAWSALAGVATGLYLWVWPPGVVLVGIFGLFFVIKLSADYVRGVSPDHLAFVAVTSMSVAGLLALVPFSEVSFGAVQATLLQPTLAFGVAAGAAFMAWLGRAWERRDVSPALYPVTIGGAILVGVLFVRFGVPGLYDQVERNLARIVFVFRQSAQAGTVAEAQPWLSRARQAGVPWYAIIFVEYGVAFFTAVLGALVMVARAVLDDEHDAQRLLVLVWAAVLLSMALSQVRFNYYLAVAVAVLNGYLVAEVLRFVGVSGPVDSVEDVRTDQVLAVLAVFLLVVMPLLAPVAVGGVRAGTASSTGATAGPGAVVNWADTLHWMRDNTPAEGTFGGADNEMDYYGTYRRTGNYDYPEGAYGVMSWWDYGHWITVEAERIPNANPFQQHAVPAANFLLAPNESAAGTVIAEMSEDDAETRYVLVDWKMVIPNSKFGAPTVFYDASDVAGRDFYEPVFGRQGGQFRVRMYLKKQRYYESMVNRLYRYHGSARRPSPIVIDWDRLPTSQGTFKQSPQGPNASLVRQFDSMAKARQFVEQDGSSQVGGIGPYPSEYVPALQHYRLVQVSDAPPPRRLTSFGRLANTPSWVKAFERVPGATVRGSGGPPNGTVTARVQMFVPSRNSTFVYSQRAETGPNGSFTMTLPYSTTGYENWGPSEGYTNVSVRAQGPYAFTAGPNVEGSGDNVTVVRWLASANVSEAKVIGVDDAPLEVKMDRQVLTQPGGGNNSTAPTNVTTPTNETDGNGSATNATGNGSALVEPDEGTLRQPAAAGADPAGVEMLARVASRD